MYDNSDDFIEENSMYATQKYLDKYYPTNYSNTLNLKLMNVISFINSYNKTINISTIESVSSINCNKNKECSFFRLNDLNHLPKDNLRKKKFDNLLINKENKINKDNKDINKINQHQNNNIKKIINSGSNNLERNDKKQIPNLTIPKLDEINNNIKSIKSIIKNLQKDMLITEGDNNYVNKTPINNENNKNKFNDIQICNEYFYFDNNNKSTILSNERNQKWKNKILKYKTDDFSMIQTSSDNILKQSNLKNKYNKIGLSKKPSKNILKGNKRPNKSYEPKCNKKIINQKKINKNNIIERNKKNNKKINLNIILDIPNPPKEIKRYYRIDLNQEKTNKSANKILRKNKKKY